MSILWNFDKYAKIEELPYDPASINGNDLIPISGVELLLKAGTPLVLAVEEEDEGGGDEAKGAVKKGATKTAETPSYTTGTVHVLDQESAPTCFAAEDYHFILTNAQQPKLVKCVTKGYIEKAKVLEAMDAEEDPTADWAESLAALGLYLVDDLGALPGSSGGGSSGGGTFVTHVDSSAGNLGCSWQDLADAQNDGKAVLLLDATDGDFDLGGTVYYLGKLIPPGDEGDPYVATFFGLDDSSEFKTMLGEAATPDDPLQPQGTARLSKT